MGIKKHEIDELLEHLGFAKEHPVHSERKWRHDYAHTGFKIAVELEGGVFAGGRHTRGLGYRNDCYKYNVAALKGWKVLRFTMDMKFDYVLAVINQAMYETGNIDLIVHAGLKEKVRGKSKPRKHAVKQKPVQDIQ